MNKNIALGVDIGGSHISCAGFDLSKNEYLEHTLSESDLDNHASSEAIIKIWGDTLKRSIDIIGLNNISGIGFAIPGPFDYEKGISLFTGENGKYENTYGVNIKKELIKYLNLPSDFKIRFINDATAFALGEDISGKAKDVSKSLSIALGTGFGSAFISNGLPVLEGDQVPKIGCLWHLPFENGIGDDYFSTRGLIKRYHEKSGILYTGVKHIAESAQNDPIAQAVFEDFGLKMGVFLKPWIKKFNIEMLVIGGNISRAYPLFKDSLNQFLEKENLEMKIEISELKETASFIGAANMIDDSFYEKVKPLLKLM